MELSAPAWRISSKQSNNLPFVTYTAMLYYTIVFLVIAIIAGILGFSGIAGTAAWIAHVLFVVFLILFLISFITGRKPSA